MDDNHENNQEVLEVSDWSQPIKIMLMLFAMFMGTIWGMRVITLLEEILKALQ